MGGTLLTLSGSRAFFRDDDRVEGFRRAFGFWFPSGFWRAFGFWSPLAGDTEGGGDMVMMVVVRVCVHLKDGVRCERAKAEPCEKIIHVRRCCILQHPLGVDRQTDRVAQLCQRGIMVIHF